MSKSHNMYTIIPPQPDEIKKLQTEGKKVLCLDKQTDKELKGKSGSVFVSDKLLRFTYEVC